jgi:tetratricopeptide (TPR) repeat protein
MTSGTEQKRQEKAAVEPQFDRFPPNWLRHPAVLSILLAVITFIVYLPVGRYGFVDYDDSDYVKANDHVLGGLNWVTVKWAFTTAHASNWHPLTWLSHALDCQLFGQYIGGHHLVSVGFHIANSILLLFLLRSMTGAVWRSALVAALFALHPLRVESVAWISERKDVLSGFFFLLAVWAYVRYARERGRETGQRVAFYYVLALGLFALGLMSKPMLVTLPMVLLLLDYWPLNRFQSGPLVLLVEKLPFFALCLASSIITFFAQKKGGAVSTSITMQARWANAVVSYIRYLAKTFWPENLSVLYPHPGSWPAWKVMGAVALLLAIFAGVVLLARKRPYLAVGWLWFFGTLVPVIGLVQVGVQSMADRYTYLPTIGLFVALVWGLYDLSRRPWWPRAMAAGAVFSVAVCTLLTSLQVRYWRDSEALFRHAVEVTERNYLAYNNLGYYLSNHDRPLEGMTNYLRSIEINPNYEDALNNLGYALAGQKRHAEAIGYYQAALRIRPEHPEVHNNLGNALSELGQIDEAMQHYGIVLRQQPDHASAHNNLGIALAMKGRLDEAMVHFRAALRSKPDYASAHSNLGNALAVQHKLDEAIEEYQQALRLSPDEAQAHNNLANALGELGRLPEAISHYLEALRLNPVNPEAHCNLGLVLLRQGKPAEAAGHFAEALRIKPDYAEARRQLDALRVGTTR